VHGRDSEVTRSKLVSEPVDLSAGVAEYNCLCDGDRLVKVRERVQLPLLLLDRDVKLFDTFESQLVLLHEDSNGVAHELGGDLQDILWHGGRKKNNLRGLRKELENVVDLLGETTRKHLIGLVEDEHLHRVGLEDAALNHVLNTTGCADNDLRTILKSLHVIPNAGTTNACVALELHEVTNGDYHLLNLLGQFASGGEDKGLATLDVGVDLLKGRDREGSGLASTGLGLGNNVTAFGSDQLVACVRRVL